MTQMESAPTAAVDTNSFKRLAALGAWDANLHFGYWDESNSEAPIEEAANRLTDLMTAKLKIGPDCHVLDVGCGVGGPGVRIAQLTGARVTGISINQEQIAAANTLAGEAGLSGRVVFRQEDAMEMSFPDGYFDAIIAIESMMNMPSREEVLTRMHQALRPGGRLVLTDAVERRPIPVEKQPAVDRFFDSMKCTTVRAEDYPTLLRHAGLQLDEIVDITDQTMQKSWAFHARRFATLQPHLKAIFGEDVAKTFDTTDLLDISELGYLMVVAER